MTWLRRMALSLCIILFVALAVAGRYYYKGFYQPKHANLRSPDTNSSAALVAESERLSGKIAEQAGFVKRHGYNPAICFLIDMHLPSGKNRFFVYDLQRDSILMTGLVAHGSGNGNFSFTPTFSNVSGSGCSSLGRYRVGGAYKGQFGIAYKLHGIDTTNDQAFARNVVLHSYSCVPEGETDPLPICNSKGCAMVSPGFIQRLHPLIDASKKPILLWIFD